MTSNNSRIAKNTLLLYVRMFAILLITLYTSRVVLEKLGVVDYGVNNVIAGMVMMFGFFSSSLSNATQRFLNFQLGRGDFSKAGDIFNLSVSIYLALSILVLVVAETVGLWFVTSQLSIPSDRMTAAIWTYHFTVLSLCFTLNGIVFNSIIIARENMKVFAYIGICEAIGRFFVAYMISVCNMDRLILYGALMAWITLLVQLAYFFVSRQYPECRFYRFWDKKMFRQLCSFIGWNAFGTTTWVINQQGLNILLNIFFGPAVNAARGVALQVNSAVSNFTVNFFTAVRPQIVKSYAHGDTTYFNRLLLGCSKYGFFLLLLICLPLFSKTDYILKLWLINVPEHTTSFTRLVLLFTLVDVLSNPLWFGVQAVGRLKFFCLIGGCTFLLAFPMGYAALKFGALPESVFVCLIMARILYLIVALCIFRRMVDFCIKVYVVQVLFPILKVAVVNVVIAFLLEGEFTDSLLSFIAFVCCIEILALGAIWLLGLQSSERQFALKTIRKYINKK